MLRIGLPLTALIVGRLRQRRGRTRTHLLFVHTLNHRRVLLGAGYFGITFLAPVLGVICITSEYRHRTMTSTWCSPAGPGAERQIIVTAWWCPLIAILSLVPSARSGCPGTPRSGVSRHRYHQLGAVVPGLVAATILLGLFGLGFGTLGEESVPGYL